MFALEVHTTYWAIIEMIKDNVRYALNGNACLVGHLILVLNAIKDTL